MIPHVPAGFELVIVVLVIVLVFGSKRLPDSARALGRSMRILKAEAKGMKDDGKDDAAPTTVTTAQVEASPAPVVTDVPPASPQQAAAQQAAHQQASAGHPAGQTRQP